jgi:hypothetical protein
VVHGHTWRCPGHHGHRDCRDVGLRPLTTDAGFAASSGGLPPPVLEPFRPHWASPKRNVSDSQFATQRAPEPTGALETPSLHFSPGFVTRAAKGSEMLGFSGIGRRSRSRTTSRSTIGEKHGRSLPFAARSRHSVRSAG